MSSYRQRFQLTHDPMPKDASGKTFCDTAPGYQRLTRAFRASLEDKGLYVLTSDAGGGKTAGLRNLCHALPRPDYHVLYLHDTTVTSLDVYRGLAVELGVKPSHRRAQLWVDIKKTIVHQLDERGCTLVLVIDEAQHLSDRFLMDLSGFLNFAFDSRDLMVLWLVGLTPLIRRLRMQQHAALFTRVATHVHLEPLDRPAFVAMVEHGLRAAGATRKLLSDSAMELLWRASHGAPREAHKVLRAALRHAHESGQDFIDDPIIQHVVDEVRP